MERKIADQKKCIQSLYDDLESREKFIEMLEENLRDMKRKSAKEKKQLEAEKIAMEEKLKENLQLIEDLKNDTRGTCAKGCDKYSKSVDEIYEAGVKHKSKLVDLKEIADEQKVKISCLRKHRDEMRDELLRNKRMK